MMHQEKCCVCGRITSLHYGSLNQMRSGSHIKTCSSSCRERLNQEKSLAIAAKAHKKILTTNQLQETVHV